MSLYKTITQVFTDHPERTIAEVAAEHPEISRSLIQKAHRAARLARNANAPSSSQQIHDLLQANPDLTTNDLVLLTGRSASRVRAIKSELHAAGVQESALEKKRKAAAERKPRIVALLQEGTSGPEICRLVPGAHPAELIQIRAELGLSHRPARKERKDWVTFIAEAKTAKQRTIRRLAFLQERHRLCGIMLVSEEREGAQ